LFSDFVYYCVLQLRSLTSLSLLFFFSSRRRHTRSKRDWSSDVCSSDLCLAPSPTSPTTAASSKLKTSWKGWCTCPKWTGPTKTRSEERRVGKECRTRGGREE